MTQRKILLACYTPRKGSFTKELVDYALTQINKNLIILDIHNLLDETPKLLDEATLNSYWKKAYENKKLSSKEAKNLSKLEDIAREVIDHDIIIIAYPMYNFSMPAAVKAYFDAIMLRGITWKKINGVKEGLLKNKKVFIISVSGGFNIGTKREHSISLARTCFQFLGVEKENFAYVVAEGVNRGRSTRDKTIQGAKKNIDLILEKWELL